MPFRSKAQQRWMFENLPDKAKEWASKTDFKKLPEHVVKKKTKDSIVKKLTKNRSK